MVRVINIPKLRILGVVLIISSIVWSITGSIYYKSNNICWQMHLAYGFGTGYGLLGILIINNIYNMQTLCKKILTVDKQSFGLRHKYIKRIPGDYNGLNTNT